MGRFFAVLILAAGIGGGVAWQLGLLSNIPGITPRTGTTSAGKDLPPGTASPDELGGPLYNPVSWVKPPLNQERQGADPVVIYGNLSVIEKMDACAQVPGQILFIGQEIPEGAAQVAGVAPLLQGNVYSAKVDIGDYSYHKLYHRLSEGEKIGEEDMVALVNPAKAVHNVNEKVTKMAAAEAEAVASKKIDGEAERRLVLDERLFGERVGSQIDLSNARLTRIKTEQEWIAKREAAKVAKIDLTQAKLILGQHYVLNKLPVKQSIIRTIYKRTGEAVKELEPVLHLYAIDRLTAEGLVELQFANRLALGKKVIVEPTRESSPVRVWRAHKKEITGVAVTHNGLAVSASEDGTVCLWDEKYAGPVGLLAHSHPVRSVACSPAKAAAHWLLAGLSDGSLAIWNLDTFKAETEAKPIKIIPSPSGAAITSIAFSPDGRYFATGSSNGAIEMWDTQGAEQNDFRLYPFDAAHGVASPHSGQVTSLHFTPQGKLVSAARDNTLRVWTLHQKGAVLDREPIAGRSGSIGELGVSADGGSMLFDQGRMLQILSPDGRAVATLQNPAGTIPFETLAEFSPDGSLLLTAGAAEGRLQLWKAPTDGQRAFELRQFVSSERSNATSAAFFDPNASGDAPYVVSGAKDGVVYLWPLPTRDEVVAHRIDNVKLTTISQNVETRQVRIGVEVPNDGRLIPGQPVTIVIE